MGTCPRVGSVRVVWTVVCAICLVLILLAPTTVRAQGTLGYSFEGGLQGFAANGGGVTITHDPNSVGATEGNDAMKVTLVAGATFAGPLTANLDPNDIFAPGGAPTFKVGDPPGFDHVLFDLTLIGEQHPFGGTFVSLGIFIFGDSQIDPNTGFQDTGLGIQFQDNEIITVGDLPAGTHQIVFTLDSAFHPLTFAKQSFNEIFGPPSADPNDALDIIPTGFEIYVNKASTHAWEGIIDNIRFADAIPGDFNKDLVVDGKDFLFWQRGETPEGGSPAELAIWEANYGSVVPLAAAIGAVPEPTTVGLACAAMLAFLSVRRKTS